MVGNSRGHCQRDPLGAVDPGEPGCQVGSCRAEAGKSGVKMIFLGEKIEQELVWAVRCKGCGELYVIREVGAGETTFPVPQQATPCHKTHTVYEYRFDELQNVWSP